MRPGGRWLTVIIVERQVHGYRPRASAPRHLRNFREDRSVADQPCDVLGGHFPSTREEGLVLSTTYHAGGGFVLARTLAGPEAVARAGCVRTLSLIIPMKGWAEAEGCCSAISNW